MEIKKGREFFFSWFLPRIFKRNHELGHVRWENECLNTSNTRIKRKLSEIKRGEKEREREREERRWENFDWLGFENHLIVD
jgi:hypothetical protein